MTNTANNTFEVSVASVSAMLNLSKLAAECDAEVIDMDGKIYVSDPTGKLAARLSGSGSLNIKETALNGVQWVGNKAINATVGTIGLGADVACLAMSLTNNLVRQAAPRVMDVASSAAKTTIGLTADVVIEGRRFVAEQVKTDEAARVKEAGALLYGDAKSAAVGLFGWAKKKLGSDTVEGVRIVK